MGLSCRKRASDVVRISAERASPDVLRRTEQECTRINPNNSILSYYYHITQLKLNSHSVFRSSQYAVEYV